MAYELPLFNVGIYVSDDDRSNEGLNQFHCVKIKAAANVTGYGTGGAALGSVSAGNQILGILQNNPIQGEAGTVTQKGISKAALGGTVAIGDILATDAFGQLKLATGGQYGVAQALESGVLGDVAAVLVDNFGKQ